jgi:hypothetical protein
LISSGSAPSTHRAWQKLCPASVLSESSRDTLHVELDGLRVSFLRAQAPLLFSGFRYRGLTLADPRDIAVMKVVAIGGRGSRKDFLDLFFYLRTGGTLAEVLSLLEQRYHKVDFNTYHLLKSLVFFEDAEEEPMPRMIKAVEWDGAKEFFISEVRRLS